MEYQVIASNLPEDAFLRGYLECAEWCGILDSTDDPERESDRAFMEGTSRDVRWSQSALKSAREDCRDFQDANADALRASGLSASRAGHDFYLSRNGHGAGFFDEGCPKAGDLQAAARVYGSADVWYNRKRARLEFM